MKFEYFPILLNLCGAIYYCYYWQGSGKVLYWIGATILTVGLMRMKG